MRTILTFLLLCASAGATTHIQSTLRLNDGATAMTGKIIVLGPSGSTISPSTSRTITIGSAGAVDFYLIGCNGCTYRAQYQLTNSLGTVTMTFSEMWAVPDTASVLTIPQLLTGTPAGVVSPQMISGLGLAAGQHWDWNGTAWVAGYSTNWRGAWSGSTAYVPSDAVTYAGSSFYAILAGTNHQPDTSPTYWGTIAQGGNTIINGTAIPINSSADQVLLTTAPTVGSWAPVANCVAAGGVLQYATATHAFSCHTLASADIPTLTNPTLAGNPVVQGLGYPAVTITQGGTPGTTAYTYAVTGTDAAGKTRTVYGSTTTGPATLNGTNYNIVTVAAWSVTSPYVAPVGSCVVNRLVGGTTQGALSGTIASCVAGGNLHDTGLAGSGSVPADTSGIISIAGNPGGVGSSTVYDVRKHGAQCDGITDDAPAINATILEASVGTGGAVFFPPGICRVASTVSINHYGIVLKGSAPLATTILGDLELTPVVQFGTAALFVESVGIENIRVSRALDVGNLYPLSRGIPPNSIGVLWADYNQASQFNLYTDRHYIGEKLTMTGTTSLSVGMNSFNYQSWNCTYSYLDVDSATDSNFFGGELGKNGGELVDPFSAVVFTGLAESFHMFGTDIIPLGPTRAAYMFAWVGNTSANGVFEFIGINGGDNSNYAMYSDAATPSISYMKILGGRWQALTGIFAFNAATALIAFKIDAAMFPPPFILPIGTGSTVEIAHAEMFSGVTLLGSGTGSLMFSGNTIAGPSTFSGTYWMFNRNGNSFLTNDPTTTVTATSFRVHGDLGPGGPLFDTPKPKFVYSLSPPNGQNNDVPTTNQSYIWLAGGIGTFSVSGFSGGVDGQIITVINPSGQYWGFLNNTGSSVGNRIFTYTGGDVTSLIAPVAQFVYDSNLAGVGGWWMVSR